MHIIIYTFLYVKEYLIYSRAHEIFRNISKIKDVNRNSVADHVRLQTTNLFWQEMSHIYR